MLLMMQLWLHMYMLRLSWALSVFICSAKLDAIELLTEQTFIWRLISVWFCVILAIFSCASEKIGDVNFVNDADQGE